MEKNQSMENQAKMLCKLKRNLNVIKLGIEIVDYRHNEKKDKFDQDTQVRINNSISEAYRIIREIEHGKK